MTKSTSGNLGIEEIWDVTTVVNQQQAGSAPLRPLLMETGLAIGTPVFGGLFDVVSTAICSGINSSEDIPWIT